MKAEQGLTGREESVDLEQGRNSDALMPSNQPNPDELIQHLSFLERLDLTNQQSSKLDSFRKMKVTRGQLIERAVVLSFILNMSQLLSLAVGLASLSPFIPKKNHTVEINRIRDKEKSDELNCYFCLQFAMFILTIPSILLMHSIEKRYINFARQIGLQSACFFKSNVNAYPIPTALFAKLLLSLIHKSFEKDHPMKMIGFSLADTQILGTCIMGVLYTLVKVLTEDHLKLSYCLNFLGGFINKLSEYASPYILTCMDKTSEVSRPYVIQINEYLEESAVDSHDFVPTKRN